MKFGKLMTAVFMAAGMPMCADAATHVIEMKNSGPGGIMMFVPALTQAKVGDTILFKATDKGHDAMSIPSMLPAGASPIAGKISQDVSVTLTKPGYYGIKCTPHFSMGMVALVRVGDAKIIDPGAIASFPPLAKKRMQGLLSQAN
jgi:pseudoazurin